jgi:hypothetical protein
MPRIASRLIAAIVAVWVFGVGIGPGPDEGIARAEMAPAGSFIETSPHPLMAHPDGRYRTRMGWLIASRIADGMRSTLERGIFFGSAIDELYDSAIRREAKHYRSLEGLAHYRYAEALTRDLAKVQIKTLQDTRLGTALNTIPAALAADVAAMVLQSGISEVLSPEHRHILDLDPRYLEQGTQHAVTARYAFIDLEMRYRDLVDSAVFRSMKRQLAQAVTVGDAASLLSESTLSSAIGNAIAVYRGQPPRRTLDMLRRQMVLETATYRCACVLDQTTHRPPNAHVAVLGGSDVYRTRLAFLLAYRLAPPDTTLLNIMAGRTARDLLNTELATLKRLRTSGKAADQERYLCYMRSLLVDLETLEHDQIKALQSGAVRSFIESVATNVLFGLVGGATGGVGMQIMATLGNAGYGAITAYDAVSDEIGVRMQMAALREQVLDILLPHPETCGCSTGVEVGPETVVQGRPPPR